MDAPSPFIASLHVALGGAIALTGLFNNPNDRE